MARSALPQNYLKDAGTVLDALDTVTGWFTSGEAGTMEADTSTYRYGTGSMKLTSTATLYMNVAKAINLSIPDPRNITFWVYVPSLAAWSALMIQLSNDAAITKYFSKTFTPDMFQIGWNKIVIAATEWSITGGASWASTITHVRFRFKSADTNPAIIYIDHLVHGETPQPGRAAFVFDNGYESVYDNAYPILAAAGMPGNIAVVSEWADLPEVGVMPLTELQELYAVGWGIMNHTDEHAYPTTQTLAQQTAAIQNCADWLIENNMPRCAYHVVYPGGLNNANTSLAMDAAGMLTGRGTVRGPNYHPFPDSKNIRAFEMRNNTLSTILTNIDTCIAQGATCVLYAHRVLEAAVDDPDCSTAQFQAVVDYLRARRVPVLSWDELYAGQTNPRYRSLPVGRSPL